MQATSTEWKQTLGCFSYADRPNFVPISHIEISYTIGDPAAQSAAVATDNGHFVYSEIAETTDGLAHNFMSANTLERCMWVLDGSRSCVPDTITQDAGYVSDVLSGADAVFTTPPVITISFSSLIETLIPGVTIQWSTAYNEFANSFYVRAYNGTTLVAEKTVTDNFDVVSFVEVDLQNYNKIEIGITEWCLPYRRARIEALTMGQIEILDNSTLLSVQLEYNADLTSNQLPESSVTFELDNTDERWNPHNPQGAFRYLIERQELVVRLGYEIGGSIEWIDGGRFFMSEWETPLNGITAKFVAKDLLEYAEDKFDKTGISGSKTLMQIATAALEQSDIPLLPSGAVRWYLDSALSNYSVTLPSDFDYTCGEVLQYCANAAMCIMYCDRQGVLHIEPLNTTQTDYLIDEFVSYADGGGA